MAKAKAKAKAAKKAEKPSSGGKAEATGANYETRVGAWYCVRQLLGIGAQPLFDLPADMRLTSIRCQTAAPVDDVNAATSDDGIIFVQAKRSVALSEGPASSLAKAVDQFVRQYLRCKTGSGTQKWDRPLDPAKDRLVLATRSSGSGKVVRTLPRLLRALRSDASHFTLAEVATSDADKAVAKVIDRLVKKYFKAATSKNPSPAEHAAILRLIYVQTLDVENGETDEIAAHDMLRTNVVAVPSESGNAFSRLVTFCADLRADRSSADLAAVQERLTTAGIQLQIAPDYRADVAALKKYTKDRLVRAPQYTRLVESDPKTAIKRDVAGPLAAAAANGSFLVVGEPGAGKSGLAYQLASDVIANSGDVVFIPVELLGVTRLSEVKTELGLKHELADVLANWPGAGAGILIVDALDAARKLETQTVLRETIGSVLKSGSRWNVVASVRRYDLRLGTEWSRMFAGRPPISDSADPEFGATRHVFVKQLSDSELAQTATAMPELGKLLASASPALHGLLKNIFNLHLTADLLNEGVIQSTLAAVRSQTDLLSRYWDHRVRQSDGNHDARELALRAVLDEMVATKSLRVERDKVATGGHGNAIVELERQEILRAEQTPNGRLGSNFVLFTHHILFDYAVARLVFKSGRDPKIITDLFAKDRALALMLSPSLAIVLTELWADGGTRDAFWNLAFALASAGSLPAVSTLAAPAIATDLATSASDFQPLIDAMKLANPDAARSVFQNTVGALFVKNTKQIPLVGPDAGPWMELADKVSEIGDDYSMFAIRALIAVTTESIGGATPVQRSAFGSAARRMLAFAWAQPTRNGNMVITALDAVAASFDSDVAASEALIRNSIDLPHMKQHGHEELHWLARYMKPIIKGKAAFAAEIYAAAYGYSEKSTDKTNLGNSAILPLSSNRRQDYESTWYGLSEVMPFFLKTDLEWAVRTLARSVFAFAKREEKSEGSKTGKRIAIKAGAKTYGFVDDGSFSWFRGGYQSPQDAPVLVKKFEEFLSDIPNSPTAATDIATIVDALGAEGAPAVLWTSVIIAATGNPQLFAKAILPLITAPAVVSSFDSRYQVGEFLKAGYGQYSQAERQSIEKALLGLRGKAALRAKEILSQCLPAALIVTPGMKKYLKGLAGKNDKAVNRPLMSMETSWSRIETDDYLSREGVKLEQPDNAALRAAVKIVEDDRQTVANPIKKAAELAVHIPPLKTLMAAIKSKSGKRANKKLIDHAIGTLAEAADALTHVPAKLLQVPAIRKELKQILLFASTSKYPTYNKATEEQFKKHCGWGSPSARTAAAAGLCNLMNSGKGKDAQIFAAIKKLSKDRVGCVRYQVAARLSYITRHDAKWVWAEIERISRTETAGTVICAAINAIGYMWASDVPRAIKLAKGILARFGDDDSEDDEKCEVWATHLICDIALFSKNKEAEAFFDALVGPPISRPKMVRNLIARYSDKLLAGDPNDAGDKGHEARRKALRFYANVVKSAKSDMSTAAAGRPVNTFGTWTEAEKAVFREAAHVCEEAGQRLQFAFNAQHGNQPKQPLTAAQKRLFTEALPILEDLTEVGLAPLAHHLVETFEVYIPVDPANAFRLIAKTLRSSEPYGYAMESLAVTVVVRVVEQYLADYRHIFADEDRLNDLMDSLDIFVRGGWPAAQALTFRLVEIWR